MCVFVFLSHGGVRKKKEGEEIKGKKRGERKEKSRKKEKKKYKKK